jgi:N utilization substance protein B
VERRRARKAALEVLYEMEITSETVDQALEARERSGKKPLDEFALSVLAGVEMYGDQIDRTISEYADNWSLERMPIIDRNILRMCLYEMIYESEIPFSVSINEAVELAKTYGTEESSKFVNGVLGKIASDLQSGLRKVEEMGR